MNPSVKNHYVLNNPQSKVTCRYQVSLVKQNTSPFLVTRRNYVTRNAKEIHFNLADVGEGIAECEILKWHVEEGQEIQQFDMICEVQSDKATAEITSPYDGLVTKLFYSVGEMAKVGQPLIDIKVDDVEEGDAENIVSSEENSKENESSSNIADQQDHESQSYQELNTKLGPVKVCKK